MKHFSFGWTLLMSLAAHAGTAWYFHSEYQPPVALPTRPGYVSVQVRASVAAAPKPVVEPVKKPPTKPVVETPKVLQKLVATQDDAPRTVKKQTEPEPPKTKEELAPPPQKVVAAQPKQKEAAKASDPSAGSDASEGTRFDVFPNSRPTNPVPPYPREDLFAGRQGTVVLHLRIDATGKVVSARIHASSGSATLDQSALLTSHVWQFEPARFRGRAVPSEVLKPFEFSILSR